MDTAVRRLNSLSPEQLAEGALSSGFWDFENRTSVLAALPGTTVSLTCATITNAALPPPGSGSSAFLAPTALDLSGASSLIMSGVSLSSDCGTVLAYQEHLCGTYRVAGSLKLEPGAVRFTEWRDGFTSLRDVNLTCPSPGEAPPPPCWLVGVQTAGQLLEVFTSYIPQLARGNVTIVLTANVSIPRSGFWPSDPVAVAANVTLAGSPLLSRPLLDLGLNVKMWDLLPPNTFRLVNVTAVNLAPAYFSPGIIFSQFGMLSERVWAFRRYVRLLHLINCTLVVPPEQLAYTKYWITFLVSPVPEAQANAAWIRVLEMKVAGVNSSGVFYDSAMAYTVYYSNVRITDTLGDDPASQSLLLRQDTGLGKLLAESVPLTSVSPAINATDLRLALLPNNSSPDADGRRWVLLVANFSLAATPSGGGSGANDSNANAFALPGSTVFSRGPGLQPKRLSFGMRIGVLAVPRGSSLTLRQLLLSGLSNRSARYDAGDPLAVLAAPLWGLALAAGSGKTRLENVTVLLSRDELRLLQTCLLSAGQAQELPVGRAYERVFLAAAQQFFAAGETTPQVEEYGPTYLTVISGETQRYTVANVTFRTTVAADGETAAADFATLGVPDGSSSGGGGSGSGGGLEGGQIGAIAGGVVGGAVLLAAALAGTLIVRRRRHQLSQGGAGGQDRDVKVEDRLAAGPGAGVSLTLSPSQELTSSSQAMRPGARSSDAAAAMAAGFAVPKLSSEKTVSSGPDGSRDNMNSGGGHASPESAVLPGDGNRSSQHVSYAAVTAAGAAAAAAGGLPAPGHGGADSFDIPPTSSVLGQHGAAGSLATGTGTGTGTGLCSRSDSVQGTASRLSTGRVASGVASAQASRLGGSGNDISGDRTGRTDTTPRTDVTDAALATLRSGGAASALDQMHAMIQVLGRDFNDQQLEVQGLLGKGAYGTVYKGRWRGLPVAVKSMIFNSENSAAQQQRPLMEAAISSNLAHPNIVTTYSYELREVEHELASLSPELARQGGGWRLLIIQEYCDAGPLRIIVDCGYFLDPRKTVPTLSQGAASEVAPATRSPSAGAGAAGQVQPLEPSVAGFKPALEDVPHDVPPRPASGLEAARRYVEAALMMARGLQHIHEKSIVHGDLNPNNVLLVRAPGTPLGFCLKLADFGLSVRMAEGESHMSNLFQGSPYYCAPEVVLSGKVSKSADMYSLGIMLWELQNGTRPPWRAGARLRTFPSLNTGELKFSPDTPPRYARLARDCFHGSKDARPAIGAVVEALAAIQVELALEQPA
ncbi:hypothetical protein GPECTOR_35g927 [Gonium pectorale]|uniref:Protein kinase domain-containing protein n=1 Tax=Gonium pectorale TaxID=33097 RepID=A0A150GCD1_GONPE|nr:hypothetical protein GPECTOR_35g927 [Gonium pectorale]|eukprot:KXZ47489.1 hypothetical protein GPECTOR_35g927 [Gonium pectorale]